MLHDQILGLEKSVKQTAKLIADQIAKKAGV
jgi:hypothetical protein